MLMVRGSRVTISCGFKVEFYVEKQFRRVFAWSANSTDKCIIRITDEMDMTPFQISCWTGKFLRRTQEWYSFNYYLYAIEQWALRTWVWCSYGDDLPMGLLPDTQNCGCACAGNAGNVFPVTAGKRSRHASRHVRHARAVMHSGIAN